MLAEGSWALRSRSAYVLNKKKEVAVSICSGPVDDRVPMLQVLTAPKTGTLKAHSRPEV